MAPLGRVLWGVRYVIIVPVIVVAFAAIGVIVATTAEVVRRVAEVAHGWTADGRTVRPFGAVLEILEGYLLAAILIIFAVGLYELFIGGIDGEGSARIPSALTIHSVEDLKERLGRVVLLGLVIEFFQQTLRLDYTTPVDLLSMAAGIVLVGAALYLTAARRGT
jgi:uncharacterized membrane protein YqhA